MFPRPTIEAFDIYLSERGLHLEAIVVGGLALLGIINRQIRDFDILHPELPQIITNAARTFGEKMRRDGIELADDWLNNGPLQLGEVLPQNWRLRLQTVFNGEALILMTLGRSDLLKSKLFALCDRGTDITDCIMLAPTPDELDEAEPWLAEQDANPMWPDHVRSTLNDLQRRLHHGI